jgi:hypothetical protein
MLTDAGSPQVGYLTLVPPPTAPVVVDGAIEFVTAGDSGSGEPAYVYRVDDEGMVSRKAVDVTLSGVAATTAVGDAIAVASGTNEVSLINADGSVQRAEIPVPAPNEGRLPSYISVMASDGTQIFVTRHSERAVYVFDTQPALSFSKSLAVPAGIGTPSLIQVVGADRLLLWSTHGWDVVAISTGQVVEHGMGPLSATAFGGARIVATNHGNPSQIAFDLAPGAALPGTIPLAQAQGGGTWDIVRLGLLEWHAGTSTAVRSLATLEYAVPACPYQPGSLPPVCGPITQALPVEAAAVLPSGTLVFIFGNTVGFVPAPAASELARRGVIPGVSAG